MASNARTEEKKKTRALKAARWQKKFFSDLEKIRSTGDFPSHYVGGGQPYTKGREA